MGVKPSPLWIPVVLSSLLASCSGSPRTEVMLWVTTDYPVPAEMAMLEVTAAGPGMDIQTASANLSGPSDLPATLGLVHTGGPLGPFSVTVEGSGSGGPVATRRARFTFIEGETLVLEVHLSRACAGVSCAGDDTCEGGVCRPIDVLPSELRQWPLQEDSAVDAPADAPDGDTGPSDTGPSDTGPDTGTPDAPTPTCDALFGMERNYELCNETPDACEFYADPPTDLSCDETCANAGQVCTATYTDVGGRGGRCERDTELDCGMAENNFICICTRRP